MSTFIVECDPATWARAGFDCMDENEARAVCEAVFAETLDGHPLISNRSVWRNFPRVENARWSVGNRVLLGDALHTAHFSIGSGTRLAIEDAIALAKALDETDDIPAGLAAYEAARRPIVQKLVAASRTSAAWYERFPEHMRLAPLDFAMSYITRSGRVDPERLRAMAPRFMARYEAGR
jgi:2-polyprenyl-6-methoxyphenol hydroxylase-like FAD-dependent oxidoreductase